MKVKRQATKEGVIEDNDATVDLIEKWREQGPTAFIKDSYYIKEEGKLIDVEPWEWQQDVLDQVETDGKGRIKNPLIFLSTPSRQGKSLLARMLFAYSLAIAQDFRGFFISTSEREVRNIQFNELKKDIKASPVLSKIIPEKHIQRDVIKNIHTDGTAKLIPQVLPIGWKADIVNITEAWQISDASILTGAYLRVSESNGTLILDSLMPEEGSPYRSILSFEDEPDAIVEVYQGKDSFFLNPNMDVKQYKRLETISLKKDFDTQVKNLGQSGQTERAFSDETIDNSIRDFRIPADVNTIKNLTHEKIGGIAALMGLDRSEGKSSSDDTALILVLKFMLGDTSHFAVSNLTCFPESSGDKIKATVKSESERLGMDITAIGLESYQSLDLYQDFQKKSYISEAKLISATTPRQREAFTLLKRLMAEGRLWIPSRLQGLIRELKWFGYDGHKFEGLRKKKGGDQKISDDRIYGLAWAVFVGQGVETTFIPSVPEDAQAYFIESGAKKRSRFKNRF